MIPDPLLFLFASTVPADIEDDLHANEIIIHADKFLQLLSKIAPDVPLPSAEELTIDFLNRL